MNEFEGLSKKERKSLKKQLEKKEQVKQIQSRKIANYSVIVIVLLIITGVVFWLLKSENGPKPGQTLADLGRDHIPLETKVDYNSNPPTSGPHDADWKKGGIYDFPPEDKKLVHSLEHGYIIISYNCDWQEKKISFNLISSAFAHEEDSSIATNSAKTSTDSAHLDLGQWKSDKSCSDLVSKLDGIGKNKKWQKIIVVPRPSLDNRFALTAWTKLDKFADYDENRITTFIKAYWDRGPEKTME